MDQILKIKLGREVKDYLSITFGLICYALGWAAFLLPYQITTGGVTGISAIIYYVTGIEIQVSYFIINAVFLGFALKILGPKFSLKTIYAIFMLTFLLWLFQALLKNPDGTLPQLLGPGVHALDDVSFTVEKGEFVAIVGPSGSGKSTLMHILGGVDSPTSGKVFVDGTEIGTLDETELAIFRRRQIGLIYQFYNLIPVLNIKENITLPLLLDGREVDEKSLSDLVSSLGLTDRLGYLPNQLSGGQQQRVSIGRALITHPALILADEPTGNLDRQNSAEIIELLKMFNRQHSQTLLVITHDENIALQADRILVVEDGRIMRDETLRSCPGGEGKAQ